LSLQELHAKSREHRSYGDADRPGSAILGLNVDRTIAGVRLSKTRHYPVDNAIQLRLSHLETRGQLENAARWIAFPKGDSAISTCASPRRASPSRQILLIESLAYARLDDCLSADIQFFGG
jgi:hypothetical protein